MQDISDKNHKINCWVITEGIAGTENQCIGVTQALAGLRKIECSIKRISLRQPWKLLSPYLKFEQRFTFTPPLDPPWPDVLITSGRKAIAVSRYIKKKSGARTLTVHIQDPRIDPKHFDLVAVPLHDPARGETVITTLGAPNKITQSALAEARTQWAQFKDRPAPRVAVLIGGSSQAYTMTEDIMQALATQLSALNASLMVTTSRRTGMENEAILRDALRPPRHPVGAPKGRSHERDLENDSSKAADLVDPRSLSSAAQNRGDDNVFIWDGTGDNPYLGMLAHADYILVTADSTSMLSDAATTGKPLYMIDLKGGKPRIKQMHQNFMDAGIMRQFNGTLEAPWTYEPLQDADKIARAIDRLLKTPT